MMTNMLLMPGTEVNETDQFVRDESQFIVYCAPCCLRIGILTWDSVASGVADAGGDVEDLEELPLAYQEVCVCVHPTH